MVMEEVSMLIEVMAVVRLKQFFLGAFPLNFFKLILFVAAGVGVVADTETTDVLLVEAELMDL